MKQDIHKALLAYGNRLPQSTMKEAAIYAIQAGGKRFRPQVILAIIDSYGVDYQPYVTTAIAIELIHLYSLIHDDLPAMDNDSIRHGVPTIHRQFDEATAILLGDGFLTDAFAMVTQSKVLTSEQKVEVIDLLSTHAGLQGMVYGQHLDLIAEGLKLNDEALKNISHYKTGKLIAAACQIGAVLVASKDRAIWERIGLTLGLMFQVQDDVLEVISSEATLQKSKSDVAHAKATFASHYGVEKAQALIQTLYQNVQVDLALLSLKKATIRDLIQTIYNRQY
jgi:geranylgeranyl diphosphate synthase, type II